MTIAEILSSVQYVVDDAGNRKAVQLDLSVWEELLAILEEAGYERRWDEAFANSQDALAQLAEQALTEHRAGRTELLEFD